MARPPAIVVVSFKLKAKRSNCSVLKQRSYKHLRRYSILPLCRLPDESYFMLTVMLATLDVSSWLPNQAFGKNCEVGITSADRSRHYIYPNKNQHFSGPRASPSPTLHHVYRQRLLFRKPARCAGRQLRDGRFGWENMGMAGLMRFYLPSANQESQCSVPGSFSTEE